MTKLLLLTGIVILDVTLCIYLAYGLVEEKEEEYTVKQKVFRLLVCAWMLVDNVSNCRRLYYNNATWIVTDLYLMLLFRFSKGRHNFLRGGIAILVKHLTIFMDYAIGFLLMGGGSRRYSMKEVLFGERVEILCIFLAVRIVLLIITVAIPSGIKIRLSDSRQTRRVLTIVDFTSYLSVLLFQQMFLDEINHVYVNNFYMIVVLGIVFCIVFFAYDSAVSQKERERLIYTTNKLMEDNYQRLYDEQKKLERTAHDFKNHIFLLMQYLEDESYEEAIGYGRTLAGSLELISRRSWSGNKILDTILNTKLLEAEQKKIQVNMEIDNMEKLPLTDYDLCVVLSNLLDNAIEASEYVEKEKKEISVSIKSTETLFLIKIVNSMERKPIKRNNRYITTKQCKDRHGIGLESVRASVERYQGTLLLEHSENQFCAIVSFMG